MSILPTPKQPGFTIVELLIVIVVIGVLAAITVVAYSDMQRRSRDAKRIDDVSKIVKGLQLWSVDTGKPFEQMNSGNTMPVDGWYDANYGGGSVQEVLVAAKYITTGSNDPLRSSTNASRHRYMLAPCTSSSTDSRRVVMAELEIAPTQTITQQLAGTGCNSSITISTYPGVYFMNYAKVATGN